MSSKDTLRAMSQAVKVSTEVYQAYYQEKNHEDYLHKRDAKKGVCSYQKQDSTQQLGSGVTGEETITDVIIPSPEDIWEEKLLLQKLQQLLLELSPNEKEVICGLFYEELTERELSEKINVPQKTINDRKQRILKKLKKLLEK